MMTPSLINQLVILLKDSSLLLVIGFGDLLYHAQQHYAANFRTTEVLLIVAAMYFIAVWLLTMLANFVYRRVNNYMSNPQTATIPLVTDDETNLLRLETLNKSLGEHEVRRG